MDSRLSVSSPRRKFIHVCVCPAPWDCSEHSKIAHCCRFLAAARVRCSPTSWDTNMFLFLPSIIHRRFNTIPDKQEVAERKS